MDFDGLDPNNKGNVKAVVDAIHSVRCDLLDGKIILNNKK